MLQTLLLLAVWLAWSGATLADPVSVPDVNHFTLDRSVAILEDPASDLNVDAALQRDDWRPHEGVFNQGYSSSTWWLRVSLHNDSDHAVHRYLQLSYAVLDNVDVYVFDGARQLHHYQMGDHQPYEQRPVDSRFFVVPLNWEKGQQLDVVLRVQTETSVQVPLELWQRDAFAIQENHSNIQHGLYYGAMLVIVVYNLLTLLILRERTYFYFVGFALSMPLFMAALSGQAFRYVWPNAIPWNEISIPVALAGMAMFGALFTRRFLTLHQCSRGLDRVLLAFVVLSACMLLLVPLLPYHTIIRVLVAIMMASFVADMAAGVIAWRKGVPTARYYCIAWTSFLLSAVVTALNKLNILPSDGFTENALQIGSVLEAVLLSFAMAERINADRKLRFDAQAEVLTTTQKLNSELEERVKERTQALEVANARLEALSNTDQLTQLHNRRYLDKVMQEEWQRCKRTGRPFAVMMMDVDFFKKVNDQYGHPAGDACLKQVAERISRSVRWPMDQVARYGGEEFCMILPETDEAGARVVAERIREQIQAKPIITDNASFQITMSLGICAGIACEDLTLDTMLKTADLALYQSKQAGRNRVTVFHPKEVCNVSPLTSRN